MPNNFAETSDGKLFIASGIDPMVKWNGLDKTVFTVGVAPPTQAPTVTAGLTAPTNWPVSFTGVYNAYLRFLDVDGNPSNLSPVSGNVTVTNVRSLTYSNVQLPADPKITRRQILRNTAGQQTTYYVDVDTADLISTSFTTTNGDTTLLAQTGIALLDSDGNAVANQYGIPPAHKPIIVEHRGLMYAMGEVSYTQGCCQVAFGSTTVTGIGTEWLTTLAGRFLYVTGATRSYQIASVSGQTLTLTTPYLDATDNFAEYAIRSAPAERKTVYYTQAVSYEAWPPENAFSVPEDGDDITGAMSMSSFLYILENRHIYRWTVQSDPAVDGALFQGSRRGCINNRCWIVIEANAYMLDEQGIHAFAGGALIDPISNPIQEIFRFSDSPYRINWDASEFFHAVHYPQQEVVRWFVALAGSYLPQHCLAYSYRQRRWWIEALPCVVGASCTGWMDGQRQIYLGANSRRTLAYWQDQIDGPDASSGTVYGTVTSAGLDSITDLKAAFTATTLVNNPVAITDGTGKGQVNIVRQVNGMQLLMRNPWSVQPDTTSIYQLGGIPWIYRMGWLRFMNDEQKTERRWIVEFQNIVHAGLMNVQLWLDSTEGPVDWTATISLAEGQGVRTIKGDPNQVVDLTKVSGYVEKRFPGQREFNIDAARYMHLLFGGFSNVDMQKIYLVQIDGVAQG